MSTTVNLRDGEAREAGANALDVVRVERADGPPVRGSKRKALRTPGWMGRVAEKVNAILEEGVCRATAADAMEVDR